MSAKSMDVFSLRDSVVSEYKNFSTSFTTIFADDIRKQVEDIYATDKYWPEPLLQINPYYRRDTTVAAQVKDGSLHPTCAEIFQRGGQTLTLYQHQKEAIALAATGSSYVVTTGTGSGKSLCFFIPIVDAILRAKDNGGPKRTRAIIIYPMNALANSQLEELQKYIGNVPGARPVTFARFTGQESQEERRKVADEPPDILLTNFMMLELLMTRQDGLDRRVMDNCQGLNFLVLDELHTYRGRQGADVALLVRRVRERLSPGALQCVGTSATMASEGTLDDKSQVVADVSSRLFATEIPRSNVIVETLERVTETREHLPGFKKELAEAIERGVPKKPSNADLKTHPLAIWVETTLGISYSDPDQKWLRARPLTLTEAVRKLQATSGKPSVQCERVLRAFLLLSSEPEENRIGKAGGESTFFAFRLHQFFSGAGHAYSTFEALGARTVTVDGQKFLPASESKLLFSVHFCRDCGHEYHPVRLVNGADGVRVSARDIDDAALVKGGDEDLDEPDNEVPPEEVYGFLTPHALDAGFTFSNQPEDFPENWLEESKTAGLRLKAHYRKVQPQELWVEPSGAVGSGIKAWFIPGKHRFCLRCGTTHGGSAKDRNRLASLSAVRTSCPRLAQRCHLVSGVRRADEGDGSLLLGLRPQAATTAPARRPGRGCRRATRPLREAQILPTFVKC